MRDDCTAFNFAAVSYGMLYTTAAGLGDHDVAEIADKHLRGRTVQTGERKGLEGSCRVRPLVVEEPRNRTVPRPWRSE